MLTQHYLSFIFWGLWIYRVAITIIYQVIFQSCMTIFHHQLLTTEGRVDPMDELIHQTMTIFFSLIRKKCHPKSYHIDIKYNITLNILCSVVTCQPLGLAKYLVGMIMCRTVIQKEMDSIRI